MQTLLHGKYRACLKISWLAVLFTVAVAPLYAQKDGAAPVKTNPQGYKAGGVELTIPPPTSDLLEMGDYRTMMDTFVPDGNRLLAAFLLPDDLKVFQSGTRKGLLRYALVEVPRNAEFTDISAADFQEAATSVDKQFASSSDSAAADALIKEGEDMLNRKLKALNLNAPTTTLDKPAMLGKFFSKTDAYCFGMAVPVASNGSKVNMLVGVLLMRVRSRIVYIYLYSEYKGDETEQWMRKTSENWADAVQRANPQP